MKLKFTEADKINSNNRLYPKTVLDNAIENMKQLIDESRSFVYHKIVNGTPSIEDVWALITDAYMEDDIGYVVVTPLHSLPGNESVTKLVESGDFHIVSSGEGNIIDGVIQDDFRFTYLFLTDEPSYG